jgi:PEP-CTERM motif
MSKSLRVKTAGPALAVCLLLAAFAAHAAADSITYSNQFKLYGTIKNRDCGKGICGASEAENIFIYLDNLYPKIYGPTRITTGAIGNNLALAAADFAFGGADGITGYYNLKGNPATDYTFALKQWLTTYAAGTTTVVSYAPSDGAGMLTAFLAPELQQHAGIQLFIYNSAGLGHVIAPFSITYNSMDPGAGGTMIFQDPNAPDEEQKVTFTVDDGQMQFFDPKSGLGQVSVTAGFAESPVPEPATLFLLGTGIFVLAWVGRRQNIKTASPEADRSFGEFA